MRHYGRSRRKRGSRSIRVKPFRLAVTVCSAIVLILSLYQLISYAVRSVNTSVSNAKLQQLYESSNGEEDDFIGEDTSFSDEEISTVEVRDDTVTLIEPDEPTASRDTGVYQYIGGNIAGSAKELYEVNPDLIGWVKIPGVVNLPVVFRDNDYYLTHDFYGRESSAGTLFLDIGHPLRPDTQYLLIHGHAMHDGSMFGGLPMYRRESYITEHPYLTFNTLYSKDSYEIIGVCLLTVDEMFSVANIGTRNFMSDEDFNAFIQNLRAHAEYFTDDEIPTDTALLALSTCFNDKRLVVYFRRISSEPFDDAE